MSRGGFALLAGVPHRPSDGTRHVPVKEFHERLDTRSTRLSAEKRSRGRRSMFTTGRIFLDWNTHLMEGNFRLITEVSSGGGTFPFRPSRAIDGQRGKRKKKGQCKQFKSRTPVAGVSPPEGLFSLFIRPAFGCWLTLKNFIQVDSLATRYRRQLAVFFFIQSTRVTRDGQHVCSAGLIHRMTVKRAAGFTRISSTTNKNENLFFSSSCFTWRWLTRMRPSHPPS